jgi:hypothetical protein
VHGRPKGDEANSNFSNHKPPQHFGQELEQFETVATWHEDLTAIFSSPTTGNGPKRDFNLYRMRWRLRGEIMRASEGAVLRCGLFLCCLAKKEPDATGRAALVSALDGAGTRSRRYH